MKQSNHPYQDSSLSVAERVENLLSLMTLEEKIAQMGSHWIYELLDGQTLDKNKVTNKLAKGIGQITRLAGGSSLDPEGCAHLGNQLQRYLTEETRLGIPVLIHEECCSGYTAQNATAFPQIIGLASTWEPQLAQAMTKEISKQMRALGAHQGLSPILDIGRDPRWGRIEETFGEDPYLVAKMGVAYVRGLQGESLADGVIATTKHFVGYSVTEGGLNWAPAHIGERELHEIYLHPFEAAVKEANTRSLMAGYHELDGIPVSASRYLMTELIRDDWGFDGIVVSDYMSINSLYNYHNYARDKAEASLMSLDAGVDVELPSTDCYGEPILEAVKKGQVPEALIDQSVRRILQMKFELGLFENPYVAPEKIPSVFDTAAQRKLAKDIAEKSFVLLKNDKQTLPLSHSLSSIALIGPNADDIRNMLGDYSYPAHIEILREMHGEGISNMPMPETADLDITFVPMKSIREALSDAVSEGTTIHYAKGCEVLGDSTEGFAEAVSAAEKSDLCLLVLGDKSGLGKSCSTGEFRDRASLTLPGVQEDLVKAVVATGKPVVVVFINGRPVSSPWISENADAILEAWLPGEEGADAVVDALFGRINPGGKLPVTVLRTVGQVPLFYNHKPSGAKSFPYGPYVDESNRPLYPFGFGLSYTSFELSDFSVSASELQAHGSLCLTVKVKNTGTKAGDEIVQLYTRHHEASVTRPVKELKGFQRVSLQPGESKTVQIKLFANQLGYYDKTMNYVLEPGRLELMLGTSSETILFQHDVQIIGETTPIKDRKVFFSEASIL
ncbi:MAG: glycoside hydrolase family 3 C-terminal domain-containing protein [Trueperaceae bacterium]|nr:glycoside hydrolase family 3 C-terminal domain-containing protein [Trueperaceae bacterium]